MVGVAQEEKGEVVVVEGGQGRRRRDGGERRTHGAGLGINMFLRSA